MIARREKDGHRMVWHSEQYERPKVVNVRMASDEANGIDMAQVTVRVRHRQASFPLNCSSFCLLGKSGLI